MRPFWNLYLFCSLLTFLLGQSLLIRSRIRASEIWIGDLVPMGEAFSEDQFKGRSILVGLEMNAKGKELLDWTLDTVAEQGDRVVAVHICHYSDLKNTTFSLIKVLEDYLETCESLCNLKQIVLVGRVSRGKSIRETLVKEAKVYDAEKVIVGANKQISLGGSASLAKYCARKLPPTTAVMAVQNGKVIFKKVATTNANSSLEVALKPSPDCNLVQKLAEAKLGWPLLKRGATKHVEDDARKMSVVRWVMNLPNRSLSVDQQYLNLIQELNDILIRNGSNCRWFQYNELHSSTSQFCSENLIGKGGSSQVYRGHVSDGQQVAIKLSKLSEETSRHFLLEVDIITKLEHKLIVPLLGICIEDSTLVSVYKYFQKGNLEENLHAGKNGKCLLNWNLRFRVAIGIAEALSYLHNECSTPVIHRDVKSSNILLTDEFEPQLSDFGLAMWAPTSLTYLTQDNVVGTFGYLAPEYFMHGKISNKVDVFAFGVVLLELLTGRKPIDEEISKGHGSLVMWAIPLLEKQEFTALLDPNLNGKYEEAEMKRMMMAASLCITRRVHLRPRMREILSLLQGEESMESWMNCHSDATSKSNRASDCQDDGAYPCSSIGSHLSLALFDVEDDTSSFTSFEQSNLGSLDDYIRERWGRSLSFE
ncbi:probable serine/threonine-protein kinase PBL5 isoform X3 [Zingiber officinale]|uniref:probable serine/threonine-protein kinase PBL5 isoform X3 n=1 Tax=Zingiber officinale TaxID=94328 RepID=UPI001C4BC0BE|nr:probable serine/threonine-protein kinase PBL5 isoform X3 [Zingiber officinale]XP_042440312.1 probable serine/threonine-protein kinase PBL5 isoform X3 [Zingiber officinale]